MNKILLIRFSSIGDIVLTTPVVRVLKTQFDCELHVLTKEKFAFLYEHNPYVDQVHTIQKGVDEVLPELKTIDFDFIVDLQKNLRSSRIKNTLDAPSASFPKLNRQKWMLVNLKINKLPEVHVVDRYFMAVRDLELVNDGKGLDYFIPEDAEVDLVTVDPVLKDGYIAIAIGGQHITKILPVEKLVPVIDNLQLPVVLLGDQQDDVRGKEVLQRVQRKDVFNLCGQYTLDQSASLIRQSAAVISNDTGLMHIAAAFKKPVVSVWGNTIPEFGMYPYMPGYPELSVIAEVKDLSCRPCSKLGYKRCPVRHFKCMRKQDEMFIAESANGLAENYLRENLSR